jgi:hypothetical protein
MVSYVRENLSAEEYLLFLDMVDPQGQERIGEGPLRLFLK